MIFSYNSEIMLTKWKKQGKSRNYRGKKNSHRKKVFWFFFAVTSERWSTQFSIMLKAGVMKSVYSVM